MRGMMMERPLRIADILSFAAEVHAESRVVSARVEGDVHTQTYAETARRVAQLANALTRMGVAPGERVATLAWNGHRHLELYYAVPGIGAVCHTINPRLATEELLYIVHHAGDRVLFADITFAPALAQLRERLPKGLPIVMMTDRAHMPEGDWLCFEELIAGEADHLDWPELPEETASGLCYTSGTTGHPKGALYSHRSTVLHALMSVAALPGTFQAHHAILPAVPLFHVNAWGTPYSAPLTGSSLVLPGPRLDGKSLFELLDREAVYSAWGVPTVWLALLGEIDARGRTPQGLCELLIGGSAAPRAMIDRFEDKGITVTHAWGMTEMSPLGTQNTTPPRLADAPAEAVRALKESQGRRLFGLDFKIVDDDGRRQPHDGRAVGELYVRGNTVISGYFENAEATAAAIDGEGWFGTGDVARIGPDGMLTITDRAKDLIKSGGEWISSLELENAALLCEGVAQCAVVAIAHEKWGERPLLVVVPAEGAAPQKAQILAALGEHFARWQLPDDVVFVEALPLTATGKISKRTLRGQFAGHTASAPER